MPALLFAQKTATLLPDHARKGEYLVVSVTGTNTNFSAGSNTLQFYYQGSPTSMLRSQFTSPTGSTQMAAGVFVQGSATTGAYTYKIFNAIDGTINGTQPFYVNPDTGTASIVSMVPATMAPGSNLSVVITGTNTHFSKGSNTTNIVFTKNGNPGLVYNSSSYAIDDTHLQAYIHAYPTAATGWYDLHVSNAFDGTLNLTDALQVANGPIPAIVGLTPNIGHVAQNLTVNVIGTRTQFTQGSPTVLFMNQGSPTTDIQVQNINVVNDSSMDVSVSIAPFAQRGYYGIFYTNQVLILEKPDAFEVTWPIGLKEQSKEQAMKVYPNPAKDEVQIEVANDKVQKVELMDLQGRVCQSTELPLPAEKVSLQIDDFILPNAYYLLKVYTREGVFYSRLRIE